MTLFTWLLIAVAVATLIALLITIWYDKAKYRRVYADDVLTATFATFAVITAVSALVFGVATLKFNSVEPGSQGVGESYRDTHELKALNLEGEEYATASGSMFLLIGGASAESGTYEEIQYIQESKDGGMSIQSVDLDESRIFELGKDEKPYVDVVHYRYDNSWYAPWTHGHDLRDARYEFHVPVGTVVQNYSVDITAE